VSQFWPNFDQISIKHHFWGSWAAVKIDSYLKPNQQEQNKLVQIHEFHTSGLTCLIVCKWTLTSTFKRWSINKSSRMNLILMKIFLIRDALIPFVTDNTVGSYVGMTDFGPYGGIAYQVLIYVKNTLFAPEKAQIILNSPWDFWHNVEGSCFNPRIAWR
jgi:hypothetical protein